MIIYILGYDLLNSVRKWRRRLWNGNKSLEEQELFWTKNLSNAESFERENFRTRDLLNKKPFESEIFKTKIFWMNSLKRKKTSETPGNLCNNKNLNNIFLKQKNCFGFFWRFCMNVISEKDNISRFNRYCELLWKLFGIFGVAFM